MKTKQDNPAQNIIIAAGGTGGHIYPALALAKALEGNYSIHWLGSVKGMENDLVPQYGYSLSRISIQGLRGKNWRQNLTMPYFLIKASVQTLKIFYQIKPKFVITTGGYVAGLAGLMTKLMGITLIIQEQNAIAGSSNRMLARLTKHIFQAFDKSLNQAITTGNPILLKALPKEAATKKIKVLVLGGSLGAKAINDTIVSMAINNMLNDFDIKHQTGKAHYQSINKQYQTHKNIVAFAFIDNMAKAYAWADIVICRAGAMTISELMLSGSASIIIPLPHAIDDHQLANANVLVSNNAAILMVQKELTANKLQNTLKTLTRAQIQVMSRHANALAKPNATDEIISYIKNLDK